MLPSSLYSNLLLSLIKTPDTGLGPTLIQYDLILPWIKSAETFSSVQSLSHVQLFATPWTTAHQASLASSWSFVKLISIESVMPSNHLILCCPLLLLPSIFPSIRVFSNESVLRIRWPKYWSFSFSISPANEYSGLILDGLVGSPCNPRDSQESSPTPQFKSINSSALSFLYRNLISELKSHSQITRVQT